MLSLLLAATLAATPPPEALDWDPRVDLPVVGVTLTGWLVSELALKRTLAPPDCRWCATNAFDTGVRRLFNPDLTSSLSGRPGADLASNVMLGVVPLSMLGLDALLALRDGGAAGLAADFTVIAEAVLVGQCLNQVVKFSVGRARPYLVGGSGPPAGATNPDDELSFFSGHTTFVFAAVAATGTVATLRGYRLAWLTWVVGTPLALATGVLRLAADKHWASDVLVGMAVGTAVGVGLPLLFHRVKQQPVTLSVSAFPGGVSVSGAF